MKILVLAIQIKAMSEKDLAQTWTLYVKELAVLLLAVEGQEAPPEVLWRIQTLVQHELLFLYFQCAPHPPEPGMGPPWGTTALCVVEVLSRTWTSLFGASCFQPAPVRPSFLLHVMMTAMDVQGAHLPGRSELPSTSRSQPDPVRPLCLPSPRD